MRVLVTGASGFLGSRVVGQLRAHDHDVVALVRPTSDRSRLTGDVFDVALGDVTDRASVGAAVRGVDIVIHCAAAYEMGAVDTAFLDAVNVDGARNVFAAGADAGVPVVHTSSVTAYGPTGRTPEREDHWSTVEPVSEYERTKREAHLAAREFNARGADIRIAAPGGVYGPNDTSVLGRLMKLYMTVPMPVVAFREAIQTTVYVDDCADGLVRIAEQGAPGQEYLLVAEHVTMQEWIAAMVAAVDKPEPLFYVPDRWVVQIGRLVEWGMHAAGGPHRMVHEYLATATRNYAYSGERARDELGWHPRPLAVGLEHLARSFGRRVTKGV